MPSSDALDAKSLKSVPLDTIEEYKLTERVVAQCYDGATSRVEVKVMFSDLSKTS